MLGLGEEGGKREGGRALVDGHSPLVSIRAGDFIATAYCVSLAKAGQFVRCELHRKRYRDKSRTTCNRSEMELEGNCVWSEKD